jgi:hypothetical protein
MSYRYWWRDPKYGGNSDLEPLRGYEGKYCGGRHADRFADALNSSGGWANVYIEGGKQHHADRANDYKVTCRYCGDRLTGTAAGVEAQESEPEAPRSYERRKEVLRGRQHSGRAVTYASDGYEPERRELRKPKSRAARVHQAGVKRTGTRRDPAPGGDSGYTGRHRGKVFDT